MAQSEVELSLILPALNESAVIEKSVKSIRTYMTQTMPDISYELIVVAARDKDNTAELAEKCAALFKAGQLTVISPRSKVGKGRDVALGFGRARGKYQLFTDADLAIPPKYIRPAYECLVRLSVENPLAAVFGVRSNNTYANGSRKLMSYAGSTITRALFWTNITDLQCGFKAFTAAAAHAGFEGLQTKGWAFDVEVFVRLSRHKAKLEPLTITDWQSETHRLAGENLLKASLMSLIEMIRIRIASLFY